MLLAGLCLMGKVEAGRRGATAGSGYRARSTFVAKGRGNRAGNDEELGEIAGAGGGRRGGLVNKASVNLAASAAAISS